jgi:DNA-binding transcriptional regulator YhcF (GntR family)
MAPHILHSPRSPELPDNGVRGLVAKLRASLYFGKLAPGDRLPGIRELARRLHVSPTTALHWYGKLKDEGFVEGRQRSGTYLRTVGIEIDRGAREVMLFKTVSSVARKLRLLGVEATDFSQTLLRCSGAQPREDFKFAFMASLESFEILKRQLLEQLKLCVPLVWLPPAPVCDGRVRHILSKNRSIRCLLSPYVHVTRLFKLARAFDLYMIVMGLDAATVRVFDAPVLSRRYIIVRDRDCAEASRRLVRAVCSPEQADRICVLGVEELDSLTEVGRDASEIYASPLCIDQVRARLSGRMVGEMPLGYSQQAVDAILFHYLLAESGLTTPRTRSLDRPLGRR